MIFYCYISTIIYYFIYLGPFLFLFFLEKLAKGFFFLINFIFSAQVSLIFSVFLSISSLSIIYFLLLTLGFAFFFFVISSGGRLGCLFEIFLLPEEGLYHYKYLS